MRARQYTASYDQLPEEMRIFLDDMQDHFTSPVNLVRQAPAVSKVTAKKAVERICGKCTRLCFNTESVYMGFPAYSDLVAVITFR